MPTYFLSKKNVLPLLNMKDVITVVEKVLRDSAEGKTSMPHKSYLNVKSGDFRAMPAMIPGAAGIKWVNVHPGNGSYKLPTVMAVIIYNDPATGYPLAIMDATDITAYRTGATSAIASKYMAAHDVYTLGICGAGRQAYTQMEAHLALYNFDKILVYDKSPQAVTAFLKYFSRYPVREASLSEIGQSDIICTVTPSRESYLMKDLLKPGVHINAIGADAKGKEELEPDIFRSAVVVVDDLRQATDAGEIFAAVKSGLFNTENIYSTLGEMVGGKKILNRDGSEVTVFVSTGIAIADIAVADMIYKKVRETGGYLQMDFLD